MTLKTPNVAVSAKALQAKTEIMRSLVVMFG